jgi:hypothetical protein
MLRSLRTSLKVMLVIGTAALSCASEPGLTQETAPPATLDATVKLSGARGESAAILKNKRGVMMQLESKEVGVRYNFAATGGKIVMANNPGCKIPKTVADR